MHLIKIITIWLFLSPSKPFNRVKMSISTRLTEQPTSYNNHLATLANRGRVYAHDYVHDHTTTYSVCVGVYQ